MRISGNYFDRLWYNILPFAIFCGVICGIFSTNKLQAFLWLGGVIFIIIWLIDTVIIFRKFGTNLNTLVLTDEILFNGMEIDPARIIKIRTENIYPDSIISKWRISTVRLTLNDNSDLYILAKPHSIFFYIKYLAGIFRNYYTDRKRYKSGLQRGFAPLSGYFVKETSQTLALLISRYPDLRLKIF
ncbi:hypothetical protein MKJ01_09430 [Chryseobacterium sp. SSA4.19]|uniref:hypothetical protein n=1 Tax=Chryseobacterium sp. SSA4.19 TaxID=2919915 RepID=UPI001F4D7F12|nr:hypothetical protein [Chryseobacterium sp. SSA4.19]MCJ8153977.1 hypothetical protein [Chryseobacterium sp. SSA4.19]